MSTLDEAIADAITALQLGDPDYITSTLNAVDEHDTHPPAVTLHSAALWYTQQGLHVFPLSPGTKIPFKDSAGCKGATTNIDVVDGWWTDNPRSNIGIATGHTVDVIDIDGPTGIVSAYHGAPGQALADHLPPVLGKVSTPRPGGLHLYVPATAGRGNKAALLPGVDYRGAGGYVVAPPSIITTGPNPGTYRWLAGLDLTP